MNRKFISFAENYESGSFEMDIKNSFFLSVLSDIDGVLYSGMTVHEKYLSLKKILEQVCCEFLKEEKIQFPTLFSRIVYISQKYSLPKSLEWELQNIRVKSASLQKAQPDFIVSENELERAKEKLTGFISLIAETKHPLPETKKKEPLYPVFEGGIPSRIRVHVLETDNEHEILLCKTEFIEEIIHVRYNIRLVNDYFNKTVSKIWKGAQLNLIDCKQEKNTGFIIPQYIVLEPDYLIDASAVSECFQEYSTSYLHYFLRKFQPPANSKHILLGNLVNYFLDEQVYAGNAGPLDFGSVFFSAFKHMPFEFTSCTDISEKADFTGFMKKAETHFHNIRRVVFEDFPINGIDTDICTLEPSFFCEKFGFQGRLDLFQLSENDDSHSIIVELKSGKLPYPAHNPGKIAINHAAQTAVYRLIIQTVFNKNSREIIPLIFYSSAVNTGENLRMSAAYKTLEKEIINIRNLIVATEYSVSYGGEESVKSLIEKLFDVESYGRVPEFFSGKLTALEKPFQTLSTLELKYFYRFTSFIAHEMFIQKTGGSNYDSYTSAACLWNTGFAERKQACELVSGLKIAGIKYSGRGMRIIFAGTVAAGLVNFREGEICVVYPHKSEENEILSNQVLKGTIEEISNGEITVRFRYKQKNTGYFTKNNCWVIEHDRMDHSYNAMYKSLYSFLQAPFTKRNIILGVDTSATEGNANAENRPEGYDEKRNHIIEKALCAIDYFLIAGPPGTGKTSVFARKLIEKLYSSTGNNILIIAYTNRAVDELCEAINAAFGYHDGKCEKYIRIGTELSCNGIFRHRLLQNIAGEVRTRSELKEIIRTTRIFAGTLASVTGKPELFELKKFDIAIIDEASQILEPQLIGLLTKVDKYILIGDHKQLSTITLQDSCHSVVTDSALNNIGLLDCRESYFERLLRICIKNGWKHAYDMLTWQGRMHQDIAGFPNRHFYDGMLLPAKGWQTEPLHIRNLPQNHTFYHRIVASRRIGFIPNRDISTGNFYLNNKVCEGEAGIVVNLSKALIEIYKTNGISFDNKTLGVITPYRNQIALIKKKFEQTELPELADIMVDTVERYQGSQRDVIIVSFCLNRPFQLEMFSNLNREKTVDRKLNVAITRARKQLFLVGNEDVLRENKIYNDLIDYAGIFDLEV